MNIAPQKSRAAPSHTPPMDRHCVCRAGLGSGEPGYAFLRRDLHIFVASLLEVRQAHDGPRIEGSEEFAASGTSRGALAGFDFAALGLLQFARKLCPSLGSGGCVHG